MAWKQRANNKWSSKPNQSYHVLSNKTEFYLGFTKKLYVGTNDFEASFIK